MIRGVVKTVVEVSATVSRVTALARWLRRDRVAVLAYHNVVSDQDAGRGDTSLHIPVSRFQAHLDRIMATHEVVDLDMALAGPGTRPRAVITFDDAYRGAVTLGFAELRRRRVPGTVFVAPGLLGEDGTWWDELAEAGRLSPSERQLALSRYRGRTDAVREWAFGGGSRPSLPPSYGIATADELRGHAGDHVAVAGHGWGHACLPTLSSDALGRDLARTLAWVRAQPGPKLEWLALPYGEGTPSVAGTALDLGYRGVLEIRGGLAPRDVDSASVPRINVPAGLSVRGLDLRTSGLRS